MPVRTLTCLLLASLAAPAAFAQEGGWVSDQGIAYEAVPGASGAVLRSATPQTYHVGDAGQLVSGIETIRLAPDCTAKSALMGFGVWSPHSDGFRIVFPSGDSVSFTDQPPPEGAGDEWGQVGWVLYPPKAGIPSGVAMWTSGSGVPYFASFTGEEGVLNSQGEQAYRPGHGSEPEVRGPEVIRLRGDCSAEGALLGEGTWVRVEGSTVVSWLAGDTITFGAVPPDAVGPGC